MYADDDFQKPRCCSFPLQKTTVLKLSSMLSTQKMLLTLCFSHQQNISSLKNAKRSFALLSSHLLYSYPSQHLSLLGSFPFSTEIPFISMGTTPLITSLKLTRPAHLLQFSTCFTTKNPYGFVVGCKEPKPRPKMGPQHCPKSIWSLWA